MSTTTPSSIPKLAESEIEDENRLLFDIVQDAVSKELLRASNYATRSTIYLRVLKRISDYMGISWSMIQDLKNLVPIHRECLTIVETLWQSQQRRLSAPVYTSPSPSTVSTNEDSAVTGTAVAVSAAAATIVTTSFTSSLDDVNNLEKFLSRDYSRSGDLIKLITMLYKREAHIDRRMPEKSYSTSSFASPQWVDLYHLLAVDGFLGIHLKNYWDSLRYPIEGCNPTTETDYRFVHIDAVRKMYRSTSCAKPENIRDAIEDAFRRNQQSTTSPENETERRRLKEIYLSLVGNHLDQISLWRQYEYEQYLLKEAKKKITTVDSRDDLPAKQGESATATRASDGNKKKKNIEVKRKRGRQPRLEQKVKLGKGGKNLTVESGKRGKNTGKLSSLLMAKMNNDVSVPKKSTKVDQIILPREDRKSTAPKELGQRLQEQLEEKVDYEPHSPIMTTESNGERSSNDGTGTNGSSDSSVESDEA